MPPGCSDLLDAIKLEERMEKAAEDGPADLAEPVEIDPQITVKQLAEKLGWKPSWITVMLIPRKIFAANGAHVLGFDLAAKIAIQHGYTVKPAG